MPSNLMKSDEHGRDLRRSRMIVLVILAALTGLVARLFPLLIGPHFRRAKLVTPHDRERQGA
jgi:hypothetical protein